MVEALVRSPNRQSIERACNRQSIERACWEAGYEPPIICTPEELMDDEQEG